MQIPFIKMHGLGNDFIVLDARVDAIPALSHETVRRLADRRRGIGCDQLIVLENCDAGANFAMRIFNADGGEVEACGNASRAVALLHGGPAKVLTKGGIIALDMADGTPSADMGAPKFLWNEIPLDHPIDTRNMPLAWEDLTAPDAVNVGNPHVIFFVDDTVAAPLARLGPIIENDPIFPNKVNVNVASVQDGAVHLRVWERGAGLTEACGTGACATAVAAIRRKLVSSPVTVHLPGGTLQIAWQEGGNITMSGPAAESFRGSFLWEDYGV